MLSAFSTPAQSRQPLRAAGAGNEPELDFGQAEFRRRHRDAIMARQRHFEAAAERGAVNGGDNRLRIVFERILDFGNRRALGRLAELGNVGAGDKGAAAANQNDGFDGRVCRGLLGAVTKAAAHICR